MRIVGCMYVYMTRGPREFKEVQHTCCNLQCMWRRRRRPTARSTMTMTMRWRLAGTWRRWSTRRRRYRSASLPAGRDSWLPPSSTSRDPPSHRHGHVTRGAWPRSRRRLGLMATSGRLNSSASPLSRFRSTSLRSRDTRWCHGLRPMSHLLRFFCVALSHATLFHKKVAACNSTLSHERTRQWLRVPGIRMCDIRASFSKLCWKTKA